MSEDIAVYNPDLSEEDRKKIEEHIKKENSYSNSYDKLEKEGFGLVKTRSPNEKTDFSNLKLVKYGWDFWIYGKPHDVYMISGYPHTYHKGENCLYIVPRGEIPSYKNIHPFDSNWGACEWSYEVEEVKSWKIKWDEVRTRSGWIGKLFRNKEWFHTVNATTPDMCWSFLRYYQTLAQESTLNFAQIDWQEKCKGMKIWYHGKPCVISHVITGAGDTRLYIEGENKSKIEAPEHWKEKDKDSFCSESRWNENYSTGLYVEWYSSDIKWYRKD